MRRGCLGATEDSASGVAVDGLERARRGKGGREGLEVL